MSESDIQEERIAGGGVGQALKLATIARLRAPIESEARASCSNGHRDFLHTAGSFTHFVCINLPSALPGENVV